MRVYVYGCSNRDHPRKEVRHEIGENPVIVCETCSESMHRVPQPLRGFYANPNQLLLDWMDNNYQRKRRKLPLQSPDLCKRPGKPLPQTQFKTRRKKGNADQTQVSTTD